MSIFANKKIYFSYVYLIVLLSPTFSFATSQIWQEGKWVLALGGGANITSDLGNSIKFPFNQFIIDTRFHYYPNKSAQVEPFFDFFLGKEWITSPHSTIEFGLGYDQTAAFEANGVFQQGVLPVISQFNNDYRYNIRLKQILVESKWGYFLKERYRPYLFGGLGVAIKKASDYHAYVPFPALTRQYKNNTETNFSYSLGLGIDFNLLQQVRLGIGYRFSDFGKAQLGQANILGHNVSETLSQSHLYTNEILAQLIFVFC